MPDDIQVFESGDERCTDEVLISQNRQVKSDAWKLLHPLAFVL